MTTSDVASPQAGWGNEHRQALPHREVAAALVTVRASDATPIVTLAFEFLVLTAPPHYLAK